MEHLKTPRGYAEDFDPEWYLDNYIKTLSQQLQTGGVLPFALDFLHDVFNTGKFRGDKLLDLGTGPTVHSVISASRHVTEIHLSDISAGNRGVLQQWRDGEHNATEVFKGLVYGMWSPGELIIRCPVPYIPLLQSCVYWTVQKRQSLEFDWSKQYRLALENRINLVRAKVTQILDIDMRLGDPLPGSNGVYDIVVASLLLCSVAKTKAEFTAVLRKVLAMIKPGGYLVVIGVLNTKCYQVGEFRFSAPDIARGDMKGMFLQENLTILEWRETDPGKYNQDYGKQGISVEEGVFAMIAQKA